MKLLNLLSIIVISLFSFSCAHTHKVQGPQEESVIPAGIRVGIGSKEIKDGDKVQILKTNCQKVVGASKTGRTSQTCTTSKIGEAVVLKVLDHDSAIIKPDGDLIIDQTMKVEKIK